MPESKWIDKYLLRYGPATIFGAFILAYLYLKRRQLGFAVDLHVDHLALATIFLGGGFLFAYLASAPMLVFHYARCLFLPRKRVNSNTIWSSLLVVGVAVISFWLLRRIELDVLVSLYASFAFASWCYTAVLAVLVAGRRKEIYEFYILLGKKRTSGDAEFIESYRDLREHGNAFYIIYWEIVLAAIVITGLKIYTVNDVGDLLFFGLLICLAWIGPAAFSWHVAGYLECDFIEDSRS